ncbi:hypothetical protein ACWFNE_16860 [Cellulomonas sp. NPDC055163]
MAEVWDDDTTFMDQVVYLVDLIDRTGPPAPLRGLTFRRCVVRGPVVIVPQGDMVVSGCDLGGPGADAIFYELTPGPHSGVLVVQDVTFEQCSFENVGFAGDRNLYAALAGIGG